MRTAPALLLLALVAAGCSSGSSPAGTPIGCDMVPAGKVVGLLGQDVHAVSHGTLTRLRSEHTRATCTNVDPERPQRYVTITAQYHPKPMQLPKRACSAGWVYAGTPDKYTPACQQTTGRQSTTQLIVRWQPYVMRVTISRLDRNWGGDPERALTMSRIVAQRLGVEEARGDG